MQAYVVDAFTDTAFAGNPAGVVLLDAPADPLWMQQVAAELKHSETAFLLDRGESRYDLRWFTPTAEVDLCGHATLASAHVLASGGARGPFRFDTRSGQLSADVDDDNAISLDFPAKTVHGAEAPAGLIEALGVEPVGSYANDMDLLLEVAGVEAVAAARPDFAALGQVECRGVILTAAADADADHDFVSRFFAPRVGVDEDPVTGSAHCALAPFWGERLGRSSLVGVQLSPRGGRVLVEWLGERVTLVGRAVIVLSGHLQI
jgi:PhzF family phenazine biosynthesis protein